MMGPARAARRAGAWLAASATAISPRVIAMYVNTSFGFTPNSNAENIRLVAYAVGSPIATPAAAIVTPSRRTSDITLLVPAPSATRTPISAVRCDTEYATIPYSPIDAIARPMSANAAIRIVRNRAGAVAVSMMPSSVLIDDMATVASTEATTCRSSDPTFTSPAVRIVRNAESQGAGAIDQ